MRKAHWNAYTAGLARDAKARWAAAGGDEPEPSRKRKGAQIPAPLSGSQGDAG